ncbi:hypothetical protein [Streptomyces sp. SAI-127]|uniref:hypothetical protein n=1 Tax=Streptomyces sp. SAI-127 TaxID=2940543 RepID=UPI002476B5B7|nr:hypothetical protein [Streptomyces sp. SAI-127]MDH6492282.1 hypothetical protein [Streptomyces sp. SAI-127]
MIQPAASPRTFPDTVGEEEIRARVNLPREREPSEIALVVGPCRSGTTAVLRATAATGHRAYFQPFKRIVRHTLIGEDSRFVLPSGPGPVVLKETLGPFLLAESLFDPVAVLSGLERPSRLSVIVTLRHPADMYLSWLQLYRANGTFGGIDTEVFVAAFRHTLALHRRARDSGLRVTAFAADALAERKPEDVLPVLFARHGLAYTPAAVHWPTDPDALDASIIREPEPELFRAPGALDGVRRAATFTFRAPQADQARKGVPHQVAELIGPYERFAAQSTDDLGGPA